MKIIIVLLFITGLLANGNAQFVGLNKAEISKLKVAIKSEKATADLYTSWLNIAKKALSEKPNPRDTIVSEGHLSNHPDKIASQFSMKDYQKIYALSLAYQVEGKADYLTKAVDYLVAWATLNHPTGNPINDTKLDDVMMGYDMIRSEIKEFDRQIIDNWLITMAEAELKKGKKGKVTSMNNWHSHRLKVLGQIGFLLNDKKYIDYAIKGIETQVETNLNPDGTSFDFLERDAIHYHLYDLEPLTTLAIIIKRAKDINEFTFISQKETSIKKSFDWLLPYMTGEKTHAEYVNSKVEFDRKRAQNHEKAFEIGHLFQPSQGIYALALASYFDKSFLSVINKVKKGEKDSWEWQLVLNELMSSK